MERPELATLIALASLGAATVVPAAEPSTTAVSPRAGTPAASTASSTDAPMNTLPADDASFIREALRGGRQEVADSREAVTHATREDVRSTAQMLMTEHMTLNAELEMLADKKGWKAVEPSAPPPPGSGRTADATPAEGADFDRAYINNQSRDHVRTIAMFRLQATDAHDADVRQLAAKALPKLQQHLAALKKLAGKAAS